MSPSNRVALVTGASRGIGVGIAQELRRAGYRVALGFRSQEAAAQDLAGSLEGIAVGIDIAEPESVEAAFRRVENELGAVDVLVNNAGIAQEKPFPEITDEEWMHMLNVNLMGAVRCARRALPGQIERGFGRIVNISSIGGQWGGMNQLHYAAAKAGLINFTRSLAKLYSGQGITANAISPGLVATDMSAAELESEAGQAKVRGIPAGRLGSVEEVGQTVVFLASEGAAYVTGQTINLNGGMYFD